MYPNYAHFTGKKKSFQTPRRKFGKVKNNRKHKNKYEHLQNISKRNPHHK